MYQNQAGQYFVASLTMPLASNLVKVDQGPLIKFSGLHRKWTIYEGKDN